MLDLGAVLPPLVVESSSRWSSEECTQAHASRCAACVGNRQAASARDVPFGAVLPGSIPTAAAAATVEATAAAAAAPTWKVGMAEMPQAAATCSTSSTSTWNEETSSSC